MEVRGCGGFFGLGSEEGDVEGFFVWEVDFIYVGGLFGWDFWVFFIELCFFCFLKG